MTVGSEPGSGHEGAEYLLRRMYGLGPNRKKKGNQQEYFRDCPAGWNGNSRMVSIPSRLRPLPAIPGSGALKLFVRKFQNPRDCKTCGSA